jgi:D-tyrosyl-tRNA(Tyr) deacylase
MRALIQRVNFARVRVDDRIVGEIGPGLLVLLGVGSGDGPEDARYLVEKITSLRIFSDADGKMNLSTIDLHLDVLVVSQFTLYADCRRGRRPFFGEAASPEIAESLYSFFCNSMEQTGLKVARGTFQAYMQVELCNDGPVTIWLDSAVR